MATAKPKFVQSGRSKLQVLNNVEVEQISAGLAVGIGHTILNPNPSFPLPMPPLLPGPIHVPVEP